MDVSLVRELFTIDKSSTLTSSCLSHCSLSSRFISSATGSERRYPVKIREVIPPVHHALVKEEFVPFDFCERFQLLGIGIPGDLVWVEDGNLSRFF